MGELPVVADIRMCKVRGRMQWVELPVVSPTLLVQGPVPGVVEGCGMKVLIKCDVCGQEFWVRGDSEEPNEYHVSEREGFSDTCEHIREGGGDGYALLGCEVDDVL